MSVSLAFPKANIIKKIACNKMLGIALKPNYAQCFHSFASFRYTNAILFTWKFVSLQFVRLFIDEYRKLDCIPIAKVLIYRSICGHNSIDAHQLHNDWHNLSVQLMLNAISVEAYDWINVPYSFSVSICNNVARPSNHLLLSTRSRFFLLSFASYRIFYGILFRMIKL